MNIKLNNKIKIFLIFIVIILLENCKKVIEKYNYEEELYTQNENGTNNDKLSFSNIPVKKYNFKDIDNKYKKYLFYDGQDSHEMGKIRVPYDNLIEIKNSDDKKSIIITNYTAVNVSNISINFKLNRDVEVILFKLDYLSAYTSIEIFYSEILSNIEELYSTDFKKVDHLYIKENLNSLAHERSFRVGWDKGKNEFLDKISKIKVKWFAVVRDYGREKYESGEYDCEEAAMRPYIVRLYHAYLLNTAYIISQDDFKEMFVKCHWNYDDGRTLSDADKEYYLNLLISYSYYRFGLYPNGGGVGAVGDAFQKCSTHNIRDVLTTNKIKRMVENNEIFDPILYPERTFIEVDSLGGKYLIKKRYSSAYGSHASAHEFGHNMGFHHRSNLTYGNTRVTVKEFNTKGELVNEEYWMEFQPILGIMSYKYFNTLPIRKEFYFRQDDIDSLVFIPKTYCELIGFTPPASRSTKGSDIDHSRCRNDENHIH